MPQFEEFDSYVAGQQEAQPEQPVSTEGQFQDYDEYEEQSAQQQKREEVQANIQENFGDIGGAVLDKILRFGSGLDDIAAKALAAPRNVAHWAASKIWEEDFDTPEERQRAAQALFEVQKQSTLGRFFAEAEEGARERAEKTQALAIDDHGGKDFVDLAEEGNYLEAADAFVGDVSSALPSVVAALTGAGGLAVIGGSAFSSKYEEAVDSDREVSMDRIFLNSISSAGGEIASEALTAGIAGGLGKLAKRVGPKTYKAVTRNMGTKLATAFGLEGSSEVAAEAWDKLGDLAILGDNKAFDGAMRDFGKTFLIGGVIGSGITIPQLRDGQNASGGQPSGGGDNIAKAVADKLTPGEIKDALKVRGAELTALFGDYQTAKENGAPDAVVKAYQEEYDNRYEALQRSKDKIYAQFEELGGDQVYELNKLDNEIYDLESAIDDPYAQDVEDSYNTTEIIRTQVEKKRQRQAEIFNTKPETSKESKRLSKKAQKDFEAGKSPREIAENFQGRARQVAGKLWAGVPKGLRVGTYEDVVQGILTDHQGVSDLIKKYDPEKNDSIGAWVNSEIEHRANRIIKNYTKQKFEDTIDPSAPPVVYEPKKRRSASTIAQQIQVPPSAIDKIKTKVQEFAGKVKDFASNEDFVKGQEDAFKSIDIRKDVKGKNWPKWVEGNGDALRGLALASGKGWGRDWVGKVQKAEANSKELNDLIESAPTTQEFIDFATGKDIDLTTPAGKNKLGTRQNGIIGRVEAGLAELAWAEHVATNPELKQAINEVNAKKQDTLMAKFKQPVYDNVDVDAFQESQEDGDVEAQGGSIQWIWKNVLGQEGRLDRRSEAIRNKFHNEALQAAEAGLLPPWVIEAVAPAAAGGKNGVPRRGGMYTSVTDPKLEELLEVAKENWKGPEFSPQRVPINELALTKVEQNKARQEENHRALEAFGHVLENIVDKHPTLSAILVHDAYKNTTGLIKIAAPLKYASKNFEHGRTGKQNSGHKYREEHAIPASIIGAYMLSSAKQKTWGKIFPHVKKNFVQMMLSKKDDQKFDDAKLADVMPKGWRITDNVLARYFNNHLINETGGIDPDGLYDVSTGQTISELLDGKKPKLAAHKKADPVITHTANFQKNILDYVKKNVKLPETVDGDMVHETTGDIIPFFSENNDFFNRALQYPVGVGHYWDVIQKYVPSDVIDTLYDKSFDSLAEKKRANADAQRLLADTILNDKDLRNRVLQGEKIKWSELSKKYPNLSDGVKRAYAKAAPALELTQLFDKGALSQDSIHDTDIHWQIARNEGFKTKFPDKAAVYEGLNKKLRDKLNVKNINRIAESLKAAQKLLSPKQEMLDMALWQRHRSAQDDSVQIYDAGARMLDVLKAAWGGVINATSDSDAAARHLVEVGQFDNIVDANMYVDRVEGFKLGDFVFVHPEVQVETPIHEFAHIWNAVIHDKNPLLFENIFYKIRTEAPALFDEQLDRIAQAGYKLEPESIAWKDEIMAGILGSHGNMKVVEAHAKSDKKWSQLFKEWWDTIGNFLGINITDKSPADLTVEDMLDLITDEIIQGKPKSNLQKLDKEGWRGISRKRRDPGTIAHHLKKDPTFKAMQEVKKVYEDTGDLRKALTDGYEFAKKDFPHYDDFAAIFKDVAKVKLSSNPELILAEAAVINDAIQAKKDSLLNTKKEDIHKRFKQILHEGSNRKPSNIFISPNAEDLTGLLDALLPKGRKNKAKGVENQNWLKETLVDPYVNALNNVERATALYTNAWKEFTKGTDMNQELARGYTVGDAYIYAVAKANNKDLGLDPRIVEAFDAHLDGTNSKGIINFLTNRAGIKPTADMLGTPINRSVFAAVNTKARETHMKTFRENLEAIDNADTWNLVKEYKGEKFMHALKDSFARMKSGRNRTSHDAEANTFNKWLGRAVGTTMFWNARSAGLQLISTLNFVNKIPKGYKGITSTWTTNRAEAKKAAKELLRTGYMRARVNGDKFDLLADEIGGSNSWIDKMLKWGFSATKWGDKSAIIWGGVPYYIARQDQLKKDNPDWSDKQVKKQAQNDFVNLVEESQQSSDPARISKIQASSIGRIIYAFANTPFQYARISKKKINANLASGRSRAERNSSW